MSKVVLVISAGTSMAADREVADASACVADAFASGAREAGHTVQVFDTSGIELNRCRGCLRCRGIDRCVILDEVDGAVQKILRADTVVMVAPVLHGRLSDQARDFMTRTTPLFGMPRILDETYLLLTMTMHSPAAKKNAVDAVMDWLSFFPAGNLTDILVTEHGSSLEELKQSDALVCARELGRNV